MKKLFTVLLALLCMLSASVQVFAIDLQNDGAVIDGRDEVLYIYTDSDYQNILEKERFADEMYSVLYSAKATDTGTTPILMPATKEYLIALTNFTQEKSNWCGAACIQQTISFHRSINGVSTALPTQTDIAKKLGIYSSGGASSDTMASVLNQYRATYGYSNRTYSTADLTDKSGAADWLYTRLRSAVVNQTYAPIVLVETGTYNGIQRYYNQGQYHCRHYLTIGGIRETIDGQYNKLIGKEIQTVDPHHDARFRGKYWDMEAFLYNSMLLADQNGSNKVLIY